MAERRREEEQAREEANAADGGTTLWAPAARPGYESMPDTFLPDKDNITRKVYWEVEQRKKGRGRMLTRQWRKYAENRPPICNYDGYSETCRNIRPVNTFLEFFQGAGNRDTKKTIYETIDNLFRQLAILKSGGMEDNTRLRKELIEQLILSIYYWRIQYLHGGMLTFIPDPPYNKYGRACPFGSLFGPDSCKSANHDVQQKNRLVLQTYFDIIEQILTLTSDDRFHTGDENENKALGSLLNKLMMATSTNVYNVPVNLWKIFAAKLEKIMNYRILSIRCEEGDYTCGRAFSIYIGGDPRRVFFLLYDTLSSSNDGQNTETLGAWMQSLEAPAAATAAKKSGNTEVKADKGGRRRKRRTRRKKKRKTRRRRRRRKGGLGLWRKSSRIRPGTAAQANPPPPPPPVIVGIALYHWEHNPETREELINQYPEIAREVQRLARQRAQRRRYGFLARLIPRRRRRRPPAPTPEEEEALREAAMQQPPPPRVGGRKTRRRKRRRKRGTKRQRGGNKQTWLLLGITHGEMQRHNYKDPTNGGTIVTFDDGTGVPEGIDLQGNIYDINMWTSILNKYGPNYFDVIFMDGGLNAGTMFDFKPRAVSALPDAHWQAIDEIKAQLLKPTGKFMKAGGHAVPAIFEWHGLGVRTPGFFKTLPRSIRDPFGRPGGGRVTVWEIDKEGAPPDADEEMIAAAQLAHAYDLSEQFRREWEQQRKWDKEHPAAAADARANKY